MTKTIAQLEREKADLAKQLEAANAELKTANRVASKEESAKELYEMYQAYVNAGFSDSQAWELTKILIDNGTRPKKSLF